MKNTEKTKDQLLKEINQLRVENSKLKDSEIKHRHTEEKLRTTSDYLENLINYANAPIVVWNPKYVITRFNHAFEHLSAYKSEEVIGKKLDFLLPKSSSRDTLTKIKQTSKGENWETVEIPILRKDGEVRIALWNSASLYAKDGKTIVSIIAQGQDITEYKRAEDEIKNISIKWQTTFDSMTDSVCIMSLDGKINACNSATLSLFNIKENDLKEKYCYQIVHGTSEHILNCPLQKLKKSNHHESMIFQKGERWLEVSVDPIFDDEKQLIEVVHIVSDISKRKQAEDDLAKHRDHLEILVEDRTKELAERNKKLDDAMKVFVGREMTIKRLQDRVKALVGK